MYWRSKTVDFEAREKKEVEEVVANYQNQFINRTVDTDLGKLLCDVQDAYQRMDSNCSAEYTPKCYISACDSLASLEKEIKVQIKQNDVEVPEEKELLTPAQKKHTNGRGLQ